MIFNKAYKSENRRDFLNFLRVRLFGDNLVENIRPLGIERQTIFFDKENCFELGKVNLDKDITIFEIKQKSKNDPRITLTRDAFKVMEDKGINIALTVFYSEDSPSWRLSLLTLKKSWGEKEISDPKRYSFLLGEGEKTRTPEKYLNKQINSFDDLLKCFDVEVVRKEFFNHYLTLYIRLYKSVSDDKEFVSLLKGQQVELVSFTKNLLGKIVFLYFIQKKGWLGVKRDEEYGKDGDKNFMRSIWEDFKNKEESLTLEKTGYFYNDYLEWLFYDGLNKDRRESEDYFPNLKMKVPYLNGGLFKEDYKKWDDNVAKISNDIFSNDKKDGILDILDTYNFTIDEDDLYDSDIAIDPEMLGRIFEKMISISPENIGEIVDIFESKKKIEIDKELNKKFGAFYTPREIVHYMTKESLISYLINNLKGKKEDNERKVRKLFELKEKFLISKSEITDEVFDELAGIIEKIDNLLQKVKILDPAIGSGAFPMGILHEISTIRYYIYGAFFHPFEIDYSKFKNTKGKVSMYKIKRDIIQKSIYGVDISAGAIDIAKLRFWLSLVVDEETPEPLPNFEFKFVCANTLIPLTEEQEQIQIDFKGDKELKVRTIKEHMTSYYEAETNSDKVKYRTLLEKYLRFGKNLTIDLYATKSERTKQLETYQPFNSNHSAEFFDPSLMMGNAKFDIVIGNPPYISIRTKDFSKELKNNYKKLYSLAVGQYDLYILFIEKSNLFLKDKGILSFIIPNNLISNENFEKTRLFLLDKLPISKYVNTKMPFNTANVETNIIICEKGKNNLELSNNIYIDNKIKLIEKLNLKNILNLPFNIFPLQLNKNIRNLLNKINGNNILELFKIAKTIRGMECGFNNKYIVDYDTGYKIIKGNSLTKYFIKDNYKFVLPEFNDKKIFKDIQIYLNSPKLLSKFVSNKLEFSLDENQIFNTNVVYNTNIINENFNIKYILGVLNTKILSFWFINTYQNTDDIFPHIQKNQLDSIPIPNISEEKQKPFIELVDKILEITKQSFYDPKNPPKEQLDLESKIDEMVYELYGLSEEEVKVVEESLG